MAKVDTAIYYMKPASFDANGNLKDGSFEMETGNQKNKSGWAQIDGNGTASAAGAAYGQAGSITMEINIISMKTVIWKTTR